MPTTSVAETAVELVDIFTVRGGKIAEKLTYMTMA